MGAPDSKGFRGFIPKNEVGEAATWEFASLSGDVVARGAPAQMTERERRLFERGRVQGQTEGQLAERRVKVEHGTRVAALIEHIRVRFAELEASGGDAVLDLAIMIARQVVRREIAIQRDALLPVAREAVAMIVDQHVHPRVYLNPQDFASLRVDFEADGLFKGCRFIADARVARGGCRVETAQGEVDATLATRWERVLASIGAIEHDYAIEDDDAGSAPSASV
jgi:flagellar assembly protein FliH